MSEMTTTSRDVIVIGAGISGLTAAWRLKQAGVDVCVLESEHEVGGAMRTERRDGFLLEKGPFNVIVRDGAFERLLKDLSGWELTEDGQRIRREWTVKHFMAAMDFFNRVARLAEDEGHHPDLHLVGYRSVVIELWTHAIGGLSENDFIVAAQINELAV